ncbi:MAG: NADPH-dependent FMN reductase [Caulobacteraceae bacterium]|jgi:FMN reductase
MTQSGYDGLGRSESLAARGPPIMPARPPLIVGIGGTTRPGSTSERLIRAVLGLAEVGGARTRMFAGPDLVRLPHFTPDATERSSDQTAMVEAVREADGVVIGTPGYHGGVSGLVKNAIDQLEDLRDDPRPYLDGRPVGLIVTAGGWQACGVTLSSLRDVAHALRGWPTPAAVLVNSSDFVANPLEDPLAPGPLRESIVLMTGQILSHVAAHAGGRP